MTDLFHYQSFRRTYTFLDIYSSSSLIFNLQIFLIYLYILGKLGVDVSLEKQIKIYTTYSCLWPGFRIWSKINRIRIQLLILWRSLIIIYNILEIIFIIHSAHFCTQDLVLKPDQKKFETWIRIQAKILDPDPKP